MIEENALAGPRRLMSDYDSDLDILYISKARAQPSMAKNNGTGIVVRYSMGSPSRPFGVNIEKFKATALASDMSELSNVIARLLYIDRDAVLDALQRHR